MQKEAEDEEEIYTDGDMSGSDNGAEHQYDVAEDEEQNPESDPAETKRSRTRALLEFRFKVEEAIVGGYLFAKSPQRDFKNELWGVPLLPSEGHPGTDIVLAKFLKAKHYRVHEAMASLRRAIRWRAEFRATEISPDEDVLFLQPETSRLWFVSGRDKEGRPMCYNLWGEESQKRILAAVGDQKYCQQYLRWRVLCVEKGIRNLNFRAGGVNSIIQVIDLENSMRPAKKEAKMIYKKMISLLHNYYPGLVYKNLIINAPTWFMTLNALNLRLIRQKSRNKFIFVKPSKVTETLLKYAAPENILVRYGGLRRENDTEFSTDDKVLEMNIRASSTEQIQIPINEIGVTVTWDVTVVGYEVSYKEEFIPDDDCSYKILLQEKKMVENVRNSFHIREPGKIVMTIVNGSFTKKKAFYRFKARPTVPMYMFIKQQKNLQWQKKTHS